MRAQSDPGSKPAGNVPKANHAKNGKLDPTQNSSVVIIESIEETEEKEETTTRKDEPSSSVLFIDIPGISSSFLGTTTTVRMS